MGQTRSWLQAFRSSLQWLHHARLKLQLATLLYTSASGWCVCVCVLPCFCRLIGKCPYRCYMIAIVGSLTSCLPDLLAQRSMFSELSRQWRGCLRLGYVAGCFPARPRPRSRLCGEAGGPTCGSHCCDGRRADPFWKTDPDATALCSVFRRFIRMIETTSVSVAFADAAHGMARSGRPDRSVSSSILARDLVLGARRFLGIAF